jgi:signal transduction histidine kinase
MSEPTLWERIKTWLYQMAGVFAMLAIGIPGVIIVFVNESPTSWTVLVLTVIFISLSISYSYLRHRKARRLANPYLIVQTGITVWLLFLHPNLTFYVIWFYVLAIEAIMALSRREGHIWLGIFVVLTIALLTGRLPLLEAMVTLPVFLGGFFFFVTFANATYRANEARRESQRLLKELQAAHTQLQNYAAQAEQLAVAEERNRLSREMHDTIGHRLTVSAVQLEGAQKLIERDPRRADEMIGTVRGQVREALGELRGTVATLREPLESALPLHTSLERLAAEFETATGLTVHLLIPEDLPGISAAQRLALYRTAQEALTNIQKHAQAQQVWLQLANQDNFITLRVSDNGVGLPEQTESGFGLKGMRERAAQLGGKLVMEPRQGGGAQISIWLPVS